MAINMFEGARRIATLIAVFIVVGFGIAIVTDSAETVRLKYAITAPNQPTVLTEACPDDSVTKDAVRHGNDRADIYLCFLSQKATTKRDAKSFDDLVPKILPKTRRIVWDDEIEISVIPFGVNPMNGSILAGAIGHESVVAYISETAAKFRIPAADESHINSLWWSQTLRNAGMYFLWMLASLAGWWAFTWTVGWIVRGFMGIPRGSDSRG